jgi:hypothetical protein
MSDPKYVLEELRRRVRLEDEERQALADLRRAEQEGADLRLPRQRFEKATKRLICHLKKGMHPQEAGVG